MTAGTGGPSSAVQIGSSSAGLRGAVVRSCDTVRVPFPPEFRDDELRLSGEPFALVEEPLELSPVQEPDVAELFELFTHRDQTFVQPQFLPATVDDMARVVQEVASHVENSATYRWYMWACRLPDGSLAAVVEAKFFCEAITKPNATETRLVESSVYVHPRHRGHRYGLAASRTMRLFARDRLGVSERVASIRWDNVVSQALACRAGMERISASGEMSQHGLEEWRGTLMTAEEIDLAG